MTMLRPIPWLAWPVGMFVVILNAIHISVKRRNWSNHSIDWSASAGLFVQCADTNLVLNPSQQLVPLRHTPDMNFSGLSPWIMSTLSDDAVIGAGTRLRWGNHYRQRTLCPNPQLTEKCVSSFTYLIYPFKLVIHCTVNILQSMLRTHCLNRQWNCSRSNHFGRLNYVSRHQLRC